MSLLYFGFCGFCMGSADLVPGVSGSTVALLLGIYERFLGEIRKLSNTLKALLSGRPREAAKRLREVQWSFLTTLLAGAVAAILSLSRGMDWLLENQPTATAGAFLGLVAASALTTARSLKWNTPRVLSCLLVAAGSGWLFGLSAEPLADPPLLAYFGTGALAILAMLLPGISGAFVMLLLGMYASVINSLSEFSVTELTLLAAGIVVGAAAFAPALGWLLKRKRDAVLSVMTGLMLGSLRILWPWPAGVGTISDDTSGIAVSGTQFDWPAADQVAWPVAWAVLTFIVASVAGSASRRISSKTPTENTARISQ